MFQVLLSPYAWAVAVAFAKNSDDRQHCKEDEPTGPESVSLWNASLVQEVFVILISLQCQCVKKTVIVISVIDSSGKQKTFSNDRKRKVAAVKRTAIQIGPI